MNADFLFKTRQAPLSPPKQVPVPPPPSLPPRRVIVECNCGATRYHDLPPRCLPKLSMATRMLIETCNKCRRGQPGLGYGGCTTLNAKGRVLSRY